MRSPHKIYWFCAFRSEPVLRIKLGHTTKDDCEKRMAHYTRRYGIKGSDLHQVEIFEWLDLNAIE